MNYSAMVYEKNLQALAKTCQEYLLERTKEASEICSNFFDFLEEQSDRKEWSDKITRIGKLKQDMMQRLCCRDEFWPLTQERGEKFLELVDYRLEVILYYSE